MENTRNLCSLSCKLISLVDVFTQAAMQDQSDHRPHIHILYLLVWYYSLNIIVVTCIYVCIYIVIYVWKCINICMYVYMDIYMDKFMYKCNEWNVISTRIGKRVHHSLLLSCLTLSLSLCMCICICIFIFAWIVFNRRDKS